MAYMRIELDTDDDFTINIGHGIPVGSFFVVRIDGSDAREKAVAFLSQIKVQWSYENKRECAEYFQKNTIRNTITAIKNGYKEKANGGNATITYWYYGDDDRYDLIIP